MSTIFHEGRRVLRKHINNPNHAEIADFLYFRESISKYTDNNGDRFFLLPNVNYLSEKLGYGSTLIKNCLKKLESDSFIIKVKHKCYDGAVRLKIYIKDKLKSIMDEISKLKIHKDSFKGTSKNNSEYQVKPTSIINKNDQSQNDYSEKTQKDFSIIKEHDNKKKNNNMLEHVTFSINKQDIEPLANQYQLDSMTLYVNALTLQELNVFFKKDEMLIAAVNICERNEGRQTSIESSIHFSKLYEHINRTRSDFLTPDQHIYLSALLDKAAEKVKFNKNEVYDWAEFQLTNPAYHFPGKDFRHACNIIKKSLLDGGKNGYCKPKGLKIAA